MTASLVVDPESAGGFSADGFKFVNDAVGHSVGDDLRVRIAHALARVVANHAHWYDDHATRISGSTSHRSRSGSGRSASRSSVTPGPTPSSRAGRAT